MGAEDNAREVRTELTNDIALHRLRTAQEADHTAGPYQ